ncbi:vomeronasal type-2 receptor 26-like [Protopterus annectens]|uniref:vomeronasal type-2 receptor 26-like n=1 Tax=Protopterus annectens TaxID=7888 RepID=UPI001CFA10F6|nr:vomeronasal type-2 receptor 26-like [Protopterus annectens]
MFLLFHYIKHVHFTNEAGEEIFFDANGDPPAIFDILQWQAFPNGSSSYVQVGMFDSTAPAGQKISINVSSIIWNVEFLQQNGFSQIPRSVCSESCSPGYRKAPQKGQPVCCFNCVPCSKGEISNATDSTICKTCPEELWSNDNQDKCIPKMIEFLSYEEPLGVTLTVITIFFSVLSISILCVFVASRETPIVRANNRNLSYLLLVSLMLCFLSSLTFIGHPMTVNCMLRQATFGTTFSFCTSCILAKTVTVVVAFGATNPNSKLKMWLGSRTPNVILLCGSVVQFSICTTWLASSPPYPERNTEFRNEKLIIQCNQGSVVAFSCMLGYLGALAIITFIVAFLARKLPDTFNEAKFITFSMLVFVSVWLSFIPAYLSTSGKYMVAVEVFAILSSGAGMVFCIFFPKCYIILLRPDLNTREKLIGKAQFGDRKK